MSQVETPVLNWIVIYLDFSRTETGIIFCLCRNARASSLLQSSISPDVMSPPVAGRASYAKVGLAARR